MTKHVSKIDDDKCWTVEVYDPGMDQYAMTVNIGKSVFVPIDPLRPTDERSLIMLLRAEHDGIGNLKLTYQLRAAEFVASVIDKFAVDPELITAMSQTNCYASWEKIPGTSEWKWNGYPVTKPLSHGVVLS